MSELYFVLYSGSLGGLDMDERIARYERYHSTLGIPDLDFILSYDYHDSDTVVTMVF